MPGHAALNHLKIGMSGADDEPQHNVNTLA